MSDNLAGKIKRLRKAKLLDQTQYAELIGVSQGTVSRWEKGADPKPEQLIQIAAASGLSVDQLLGIDGLSGKIQPLGPRLFIKGIVAAGRWAEATEAPESEWESFTGRPDVIAPDKYRFGLRVSGDSMNEVYPEGTILECVSLFGHAEALPGKRVIIIRQREFDMCYEATVKELVDIDGILWARPRSTNPSHQSFRLDQPGDGIIEVRIAAVVVAATIME